MQKQCLPRGVTDGAACWNPIGGRREKKTRSRRVLRRTQDAEQQLAARIRQYSLSSKAGLQPSKYSGSLTGGQQASNSLKLPQIHSAFEAAVEKGCLLRTEA